MNRIFDNEESQAVPGLAAPDIETDEDSSIEAGEYVFTMPPKPKRSFGGLILAFLLLLALGGVVYWRYLMPQEQLEPLPEQAVQVYTATARLEDISVNTVLTGKVRASEEAAVFAGATALVKHIYVAEGDNIEKGALLFSLDTTQVQGGYNQAQVARDTAQEGVSMAQEGVNMAQQNLDRMQILYESAAISQAQLEQAQNQLTQAQGQLRLAQSQVRQAQAGVSAASSSMGLLNFAAPVAGCITGVNIKEGMYPLPSLPAVSIASLDDLEIAASVSEYLVGRLREGDAVSYRIPSLGDATYEGAVKSVALTTAAGGLTYPVTFMVEAAAGLKPGMFAELSIPSQHKEGALVIPVAALITRGGKTQVAVVDKDDLPYLREVATGINNGEMVEIISGLAAGETVITKGQHFIVEGEAVLRLSE
jgi:RND family efflux transporter MFP subunit